MPIENATSPETVEQLPAQTAPVEGAVVAEGAVPAVEGGAAPEVVETTKTPRTYTDVEWNKRQSAIDQQVAQAKAEAAAELEKVRNEQAEMIKRIEEQDRSSLMAKLEAAGEDVQKGLALFDHEKMLKAKERTLADREVKINKALQFTAAQDLAKQYGLGETDVVELLRINNPLEMENKALKLSLAKVKAGGTPRLPTDLGGGVPRGTNFDALPESEKWKIAFQEAEAQKRSRK